MSENREKKKLVVSEIKEKSQKTKSIVLVDYCGLTVAQDTELRNNFRKANVDYRVYKNTFLKRAFSELGISIPDNFLEGTTAVAFGADDVIAPAKVICKASDSFGKLKVKCGFIEGEFCDEKKIKALALIPAKEVLIAQLLGMLTNPMRSLAVALNAVAEKK